MSTDATAPHGHGHGHGPHLDDDAIDELWSGAVRDAHAELRARQHIAGCASCRRRYDEYTLLRRALASQATAAPAAPAAPAASLLRPLRAEDEGVIRRVTAQTHPSATSSAQQARPVRSRAHAVAFAAIAAAACLVLFVVVGRPRSGDDAARPQPVLAATVLHAKGATLDGAPIAREPGKQSSSASASAALQMLDAATLVVEADGLVELELVRGGTLRVFPSSTLSLAPRGETVHLQAGKVWALVEAGHGPFEIVTANGTARVLGTSFLVETNEHAKSTDVKVIEGRVEVRGVTRAQQAASVVVSGGERTRVVRGTAAEAPRRYDARDDRDQWSRFLADLLKAFQRGINDAIKAIDRTHRQ